ncbi:SGNH/GDSL hydrolase family protein [Streptomyces bambusae]|uniref:SGNH/GDSL hydrolase family protein n=1 Tax=Streptomyces bambusae TaxID=1550616 RepID=A0ABS6Z150_9ACTN|nr:SGNH/GDSL hydrolase family protein [Streptomyces bambusae]MBW5481470.1 SGNH/GDSL hydrolase family protein [Streptomyces bambusae]
MPRSRRTAARTATRRRTGLVAGTVAALAGACITPASAATGAGPGPGSGARYGEYVALGDSYAAGAGIPGQSAGLCFRSDRNYASLVAARLAPAVTRDVTCGAAKLKHLTEPHRYPVIGQVNAPQLDALTSRTRLVTITLGGNDLGTSDLGLGDIVVRCVALAAVHPVGSPCRSSYGNTLHERADEAGPRIAAALQEIRRRSPEAKIVITGYPSILPENAWDCLFRQPVTVSDAAYLRDVVKYLNGVIAERAEANGATYVDTHTPTLGHDICQSPSQRWIEGILPHQPTMPVHPNARGEQAMADAVLAALD